MAVSFLANAIIKSSVARGIGWSFAAHYARLYDPTYIGREFANAFSWESVRSSSTKALVNLASDSYLSEREIAVVPFKIDAKYHLYGRVEMIDPATGETFSFPQHTYTNQTLTRGGYEDLLAEGYRKGGEGVPKCAYDMEAQVYAFTLITVEENEGYGKRIDEEEEELPF